MNSRVTGFGSSDNLCASCMMSHMRAPSVHACMHIVRELGCDMKTIQTFHMFHACSQDLPNLMDLGARETKQIVPLINLISLRNS